MSEELNKLINASGFAFQLAIEHTIRATNYKHSWHVVSREHPWSSGDSDGFIDLVLQKGAVTGVVECKRTRDAAWVFIVPEKEDTKAIGSRALWVAGDKGIPLSGWDLVQHLPSAHIASFCVVRGSGENDRPLLERLSSTLLASVDALADEEVGILRKRHAGWHGFYLPIIVTTAELHMCKLDPGAVNIGSGMIDTAKFEAVPYIRFQKGFSTKLPPGFNPPNLSGAGRGYERTVWVVHAQSLVDLLSKLRSDDIFNDPQPWVEPLKALREKNKAHES